MAEKPVSRRSDVKDSEAQTQEPKHLTEKTSETEFQELVSRGRAMSELSLAMQRLKDYGKSSSKAQHEISRISREISRINRDMRQILSDSHVSSLLQEFRNQLSAFLSSDPKENFFKESLSPNELEGKAQAYAGDMMQQLDLFNSENHLPNGELVTTAPNRGQLMEKFKQFFYHYVAEQRGVGACR